MAVARASVADIRPESIRLTKLSEGREVLEG